MEKVQNVVKDVKQFGDEDDHGNKAYWINFNDGSKGIFRTPDQNLFFEGKEAEYAIKEMKNSEKAGDYAILQRYKEDYIPGKKVENTFKSSENSTQEDLSRLNRLDSLRVIANLRQHSSISIDAYLKECEQVYDYLHFAVVDNGDSKSGHEKALTPEEVPTDTLPF